MFGLMKRSTHNKRVAVLKARVDTFDKEVTRLRKLLPERANCTVILGKRGNWRGEAIVGDAKFVSRIDSHTETAGEMEGFLRQSFRVEGSITREVKDK